MLQRVPELAPPGVPGSVQAVYDSTEQNAGAVIATLAYGMGPTAIEPSTGTQELLDRILAAGEERTDLVRGYHVGQEHLRKLWRQRVYHPLSDAELGYELGAGVHHLALVAAATSDGNVRAILAGLLRDVGRLTDLINTVLDPPRHARRGPCPLLNTFAAYLKGRANTTRTAAQLHPSVRTVTYRLNRIAALTGLHPANPTHRDTLHTAVPGAHVLGRPDPVDDIAEPAQ